MTNPSPFPLREGRGLFKIQIGVERWPIVDSKVIPSIDSYREIGIYDGGLFKIQIERRGNYAILSTIGAELSTIGKREGTYKEN